MTLLEAIRDLDSFEEEDTIYAAEPWNENSTVMVAAEPPGGGLPTQAAEHALRYFLEVSIARDFLQDWSGSPGTKPTLEEKCARLIKYAITDA